MRTWQVLFKYLFKGTKSETFVVVGHYIITIIIIVVITMITRKQNNGRLLPVWHFRIEIDDDAGNNLISKDMFFSS